jgi:hypothetical protein
MITIKTMKQIATGRVIRSSGSLPSLSRSSLGGLDRARITTGIEQIQFHEARRQWLNRAYLKR